MTKLRRMVSNGPNATSERAPGENARPSGWYPRGKVMRRADKRRHPLVAVNKQRSKERLPALTVHQYAHMAC